MVGLETLGVASEVWEARPLGWKTDGAYSKHRITLRGLNQSVFCLEKGRAKRGGSGALYLQSARAGLNSRPRFMGVGAGAGKRR